MPTSDSCYKMPKTSKKNVRSSAGSVIGPSKELPTSDLPTLRDILAYCALLKVISCIFGSR